jgi:glycopeptide antibiotics resistance protein
MKWLIETIRTHIKSLFVLYLLCVLILTLYPFSFNQPNNITFLPDGGARFEQPATMYTDSFPSVLAKLSNFTLLFCCIPESDAPSVNSALITNSASSYDQNFFVKQLGTSLLFRIYTGSPPERRDIFIENAFKKERKTWYAITYNGSTLHASVNGEKKNGQNIGKINFSGWDRSYPLVFGSEASGYWSWKGILYTVALFDETLHPSSLKFPDSLFFVKDPLLLFQFKLTAKKNIRSQGKDSLTTVNIPERFVPYKRTFLLESTTMFWKRRIYFRDVLFNIFLFVPVGFFCEAKFFKKNVRFKRVLFYSLITGFGLSLMIESIQTFLPERISSISDLLSNSSGALLGGVLSKFVSWKFRDTTKING